MFKILITNMSSYRIAMNKHKKFTKQYGELKSDFTFMREE